MEKFNETKKRETDNVCSKEQIDLLIGLSYRSLLCRLCGVTRK